MRIPIGPFDLLHPLARGGMGQVWRGVHRAEDWPVAIKLTGAEVSPEVRRAFDAEVRTMARLSHPRIVVVLDHLQVTAEAAALSNGQLKEGTPGFAMELGAESMAAWLAHAELDWATTQDALVQLLDGLAHGHARGVVHRDVKAANVLRFDPGRSWKLADFGIAQEIGAHEGTPAGTPRSMAPEQIRPHARPVGPWTDVYALGCLAWELTTGASPYQGRTSQILQAHLSASLPPFGPRFAVPPDLEHWLGECLEKDPHHRFASAAAAARALLALQAPTSSAAVRGTEHRATHTFALGLGSNTTLQLHDPYEEAPPPRTPAAAIEPLPIPCAWRRPAPGTDPPRLLGAGLGLFGVRRIPLIGREDQRQALWEAFRRAGEGEVSAVLLEGGAGHGANRLAEWLSERAHELAGAVPMVATHSPHGGALDGLLSMVERCAHTLGCDRAQTQARVSWLCRDPGLASQIVDLLRPPIEREAQQPPPSSEQIDRTVAALVTSCSERRPVVLRLENASRSPKTLAFALRMLEQRARVVLVLTHRSDEAPPRAWYQLRSHPSCRVVPVPPLPSGEQRRLIRTLLRLQGALATAVEERTEGNPAFAIELIGDWVNRGMLQVGPGGFELRPGSQPTLPDAIHDIWTARLAPWTHRTQERDALELAALLGGEVLGQEWRQVCAAAGSVDAQRLLDGLVQAQLAQRDPTRNTWSFSHGMLAESLTRLAGEQGRLPDHHACCARILSEGAEALAIGGHMREAEPLVLRATHFAEHSGDELLLAKVLVRGGQVRFNLGNPDPTALERAATLLEQHPDPHTQAKCIAGLARIAYMEADYDQAERLLGQAAAMHRALGNRHAEASVLANQALTRRHQGQPGEALRLMKEIVQIHRELGLERSEAVALTNMSLVLSDLGRIDQAVRTSEEALALHIERGDARMEGVVLGNLGILQTLQGQPETGIRTMTRSLRLHDQAGNHRSATIVAGNLGDLHRRAGNPDRARQLGERAVAMAAERGLAEPEAAFVGLLGELAAERGQHREAETLFARAESLLRPQGAASVRAELWCRRGRAALAKGDLPGAEGAHAEAAHQLAHSPMSAGSWLGTDVAELGASLKR
jgi:eukaryotic-like serine/threonine-protein kinase